MVTPSTSPRVRPEDPKTWPQRLLTAYERVAITGQVPKARLGDLLHAAGHRHPLEEVIAEVSAPLAPYNALSPALVFDFFHQYEATVVEDLRRAFLERADANGLLLFSKLEELVSELGYTPLPHTVAGVLEEAAEATDVVLESEDHITLPVFQKIVELLIKREGFSASEWHVLDLAFRRFDLDSSGCIETNEFQPILMWLGFCAEVDLVDQLMKHVRTEEGTIDFDHFLLLMRRHRAAEYAHTVKLFERFDSNTDGLLEPGELARLFQKLGLSLQPEVLVEVVEDCRLNYRDFTFSCFWKVLELLRNREGFCSRELLDIAETFRHFDRYRCGEIYARSLPGALGWLGFPSDLADDQLDRRRHMYQRSRVSEQEFTKIVRDHTEAELRRTRAIFRELAHDGGTGPLPFTRLRDAVRKMCPVYVDEYERWLRKGMPQKWLTRSTAEFDFEDFRRVIRGCRDANSQRLRTNKGFTDQEVAMLRISFMEQAKKVGASSQLPPSAMIELFRAFFPSIGTSPEVRGMLKKALSIHQCEHKGMDWQEFLAVMRTYEDLQEDELACGAPAREA